jgi:hypothetical protein
MINGPPNFEFAHRAIIIFVKDKEQITSPRRADRSRKHARLFALGTARKSSQKNDSKRERFHIQPARLPNIMQALDHPDLNEANELTGGPK